MSLGTKRFEPKIEEKPVLRKNAPNFVKETVVPVLRENTSTELDRIQEQDKLATPIIFLSSENNKSIKIPGVILGETVLPLPLYATFVDHKYVCRSKRMASVLRKHCSASCVLELKSTGIELKG
jgi:hypothetical protein